MLRLRAPSSFSPIGVDLAADGVKLLQLRTAPDVLEVVAAVRLAAGPDDRALVSAVRAAVASEGFRGDRCVLALARGDAVEGSVRLPAGSPSRLRCAARRDAARGLGTDPDAVEVRVTPSGAALHGSPDEVEILLTGVSRGTVPRRMQTLAAAGLRPVAVETAATALARSGWEPAALRAILDVGATGSMLVIASGTDVVRVWPIAIGAGEIDRAVRRRLPGHAGPGGGLLGLQRAGVGDHPAVADAIRPYAGLIAGEVHLALRSYGRSFRGAGPDRVVVTGGGCRVPGLIARIQAACGVPVVDDDRLESVAGDAAPVWTVAAGLTRWTAGTQGTSAGRAAA